MTRDLEDVDNITRYLREPIVSNFIAKLIAERLIAIEGFEELPRDMRNRITEQATLLYAAGYTHAVTRRE